jgi:hypothetical protein
VGKRNSAHVQELAIEILGSSGVMPQLINIAEVLEAKFLS